MANPWRQARSTGAVPSTARSARAVVAADGAGFIVMYAGGAPRVLRGVLAPRLAGPLSSAAPVVRWTVLDGSVSPEREAACAVAMDASSGGLVVFGGGSADGGGAVRRFTRRAKESGVGDDTDPSYTSFVAEAPEEWQWAAAKPNKGCAMQWASATPVGDAGVVVGFGGLGGMGTVAGVWVWGAGEDEARPEAMKGRWSGSYHSYARAGYIIRKFSELSRRGLKIGSQMGTRGMGDPLHKLPSVIQTFVQST